ncbi:Zinc finger CCCH domain-containing protein 34 [Dichanthelium oligosanthes]|uniref:Zinc finger CCCH domain-containing protein 34 n=1 Tax=Dichanthelium oligosanthes TaxID=888268 RepID=A0A1E5VN41_9POAL|nr:Zinc finger CCCH domain-containing protein 34 [Dichanthelium oligosanthes]
MVDKAERDGEDLRRRRSSTDCVSFLASRFACTKGANCEFRHCEGARFSPSCWYWFQGSCFNPSCTFRHPPLESLNQTKPLADPLLSHDSASVKTASPCYFYYNSYCKKGGNCPFLHEPPTFNNVVGICSGATTSNIAVHGNSSGDEKIESSKYALANPYQGSPEHINKHHSKGVSESSSPVFNETTSNAPETPVDTVGYMKSSTPYDQSSGDSAMEHAEQDESRDSSPGFDVLVDDGHSNKIDFEHQLAQERDTELLNMKHYIGDTVVYGLDYHDAEYQEQGLSDFERGCYLNYPEGAQGHGFFTTLGHIPHSRIDLVKSTSEEHGDRFFDSSSLMGPHADFDHQNTQIERISKQRPERRRRAKGKNGHTKRCRILEPRNGSEDIEKRPTHHMQNSLMGDFSGSLVCATSSGQKKKSRRKQHHARSARSSNYTNANAKHLDNSEDFTGPKSLAQIKEEKCRSRSSFSHPTVHVAHGRSSSNDFEGPKSLSELLKAKGRTPAC